MMPPRAEREQKLAPLPINQHDGDNRHQTKLSTVIDDVAQVGYRAGQSAWMRMLAL